MKTIAFADVDGVLLNWQQGFHNYLEDIDMSPIASQSHEIQNKLRNNSSSLTDFENKLGQYFNLSLEFGNLSPFRDSVFYTRKLYEEYGIRLLCVTSCGDKKRIVKAREENLARIFGDVIEDVICLPYRFSKYLILSNLKQKYDPLFWIDDSPANVLDARRLDISFSFLMNNDGRDFAPPVVKSWREVYLYMEGKMNYG